MFTIDNLAEEAKTAIIDGLIYGGYALVNERGDIITSGGRLLDIERYQKGAMLYGPGVGVVFRCCDCGQLYDAGEAIESESGPICETCRDDNYVECEDCGSLVRLEDSQLTHDGRYICDSCYQENYFVCDDCGEVYDLDEYTRVDDSYYCPHCLPNNARYCEYHDEYVSELTCGNCLDYCDRSPLINEYHDSKGSMMARAIGDTDTLIGIELEIENHTGDIEDMAETLDRKYSKYITMERDSSLDNGFEVITVPMDEQTIRGEWVADMLDDIRRGGFYSHDPGTCGLHIHVSREWFGDDKDEQDENIAKVINLYSQQRDFFVKCSRRTNQTAEHWGASHKAKNHKDAKEKCEDPSRYRDVNNTNGATVEYRLGRGTTKYSSFMAWVDMHIAITKNAKNMPENDCSLAPWLAGIDDNTKRYIVSRTGIVIE